MVLSYYFTTFLKQIPQNIDMARKKIREYDAKKLIAENIENIELNQQSILVTPATNLDDLPNHHTWLTQQLVVKPDQLFGKRKKSGLVLINKNYDQVKQFIQEKINQEFTIGKATDKLTHFLIEPYIEHEQEYYLCFKSERDHDIIYFSEQGGIDIEKNWDNVKEIKVPTLDNIEEVDFEKITNKEQIIILAKSLFKIFRNLNFTYLEINPFTIKDNKIYLLDTVAHLDSCAKTNINFPKEFGKKPFPEEELIEELDKNSGASLKLTILNPEGKIWNILSGGGASIIYLDMITNLGKGDEIANYGESSGNPSTEESYQYAKAILQLMIKNEGKILFIVGGIANFTDVKDTFKGFIQALEEYSNQLKQNNVTIFVRRGGPNYEEGLNLIKETGARLGIPMFVHGPDTSMSEIIQIAREKL